MSHANPTETTPVPPGPYFMVLFYLAGAASAAGVGYAVQRAASPSQALVAAGLAVLAAGIMKFGAVRRLLTPVEAFQSALVIGALALSSADGLKVWQAPADWADMLLITSPAAAAAGLLYLTIVAHGLVSARRHPSAMVGLAVLAAPYLFNLLLLLQSPVLVERLGWLGTLKIDLTPAWRSWFGMAGVLAVFNEAVAFLLTLLLARRLFTDTRLHLLLIASALFAAATPFIATWASQPWVSDLGPFYGALAAIGLAIVAQGGLWAQTFLVTGLFMDGLHGKHPLIYWGYGHWWEGLLKGAIYTCVFLAVIHMAAILLGRPEVRELIEVYPVVTAGFFGLFAFPFLKTIIESFDGSLPFRLRFFNNYTRYDHYMRGAVIAAGIAWAIRENLPADGGWVRFFFGGLIGAAAYAGANVSRDLINVFARGTRLKLQSGRIYLAEAVLGGLAGAALAWYIDSLQAATIAAKFKNYASLFYGASGLKIEDYVIYPLFSKWGAMNLGTVTGGVKLLYAESLSGVINWSIAAPLFSVNLVVLTALVQWSTKPVRNLFTRAGLVEMIEQAFRVQRWGLWMAPIIYTFLRMSPVPSWYNQDGAIRTVVAATKSVTLPPEAFNTWSLDTFIKLLAFDWFRILIFFDHMGLRVATLVNFSFVGLDGLDEKAARFFGHSGRTRVIPTGLRRFATWAPLLIPFYIPRGQDWEYAWNTAEKIALANPQALFPPLGVALVFLLAAAIVGFVLLRQRRAMARDETRKQMAKTQAAPTGPAGDRSGGAEPPAETPTIDEETYLIGNGRYTLTMEGDGRSFSHVYRSVPNHTAMDLTLRSPDPLQPRGKFFYFIDRDQPADHPDRLWSLTYQPRRRIGPQAGMAWLDRASMTIRNDFGGIMAQAHVRVDHHDPVEIWTLDLTNSGDRTRSLELVSYREFALNHFDMYQRHPDYNSIHVATWFLSPLRSIIAQNRLSNDGKKNPVSRKKTDEVAFHGVGPSPDGRAELIGYEDSRSFFLGHRTLYDPQGLKEAPRELDDEGRLYSFSPAAALRLSVRLGPGESTRLVFVDGYARSEAYAFKLIRRYLDLKNAPKVPDLMKTWKKGRLLHGFGCPSDRKPAGSNGSKAGSLYAFSDDGKELTVGWNTPRTWAHVIANPVGYGVVVNNEGEIYSFAGNSQQNGLTPPALESLPVQVPGQVMYLKNLDTGVIDGPTWAPFRNEATQGDVVFGQGYAVFRKTLAEADLEYTLFVPPDQPVEVRLLTVKNRTDHPLRYRVVPYLQMMLAEVPGDTRGKLETRFDDKLEALFFTHPKNDFHRGSAFVAFNLKLEGQETIRTRFVGGPERDLSRPFFVDHGRPDESRDDRGYRIAALAGALTVAPGAEETVVVIVGHTDDMAEAAFLIKNYRDPAMARHKLEKTKGWWNKKLSVLRIETNDPAFDRLVNDWLPYQALAARLWGRLGPSQRSGGYGYRDQLQDIMPFFYTHPQWSRSQILANAGQQFYTGDVMQWWHWSWEEDKQAAPDIDEEDGIVIRMKKWETGLGVRNRASDPHLWLPYMTAHYVAATGDKGILDEKRTFLEGRRVQSDREGVVFAPRRSRDEDTLYQHCRRAIDYSLKRLGSNGLPLMGTGDWNDGMNLVGYGGRGASAWLGFFLYDVLIRFAPLVEEKEGERRKIHYLEKAERLREALEKTWRDGRYLRAINDAGEPLLFSDALMSSWPILSGAVPYDRGKVALERGLEDLEKKNMVLLLTPAFDEGSKPNPGKLSDYPPGVRENGGQYSHGASWLVDAMVRLSDLALEQGDDVRADHYRSRAVELWTKISPLAHVGPDEIYKYGLPPHQQPADIYFGPGYEGRGGWSWYSGAAARMLWAAYQILGLKMENGDLRVPEDLKAPKGRLTLKKLVYKGKVYTS